MPKVSGINHLRAIKAFEKVGFKIIRQGKHITRGAIFVKPILAKIK
jgi:hypothetical protein